MPVGGRDPARHGKICQGRTRGAPCHAGADAAGRAALDRRGVSGSCRHPARSRHDPRQSAGALRPRGRARHRHHGLRRPVVQQVPGQDRLRPRQAARLRRARPGGSANDAGRQAGRVHLRRRAGDPGAAVAARLPHHRRPAARRRNRIDEAIRHRRPQAVAAGARHRRSPRGARSRRQDDFQRDHVRDRYPRFRQRSKKPCGGCRRRSRRASRAANLRA